MTMSGEVPAGLGLRVEDGVAQMEALDAIRAAASS